MHYCRGQLQLENDTVPNVCFQVLIALYGLVYQMCGTVETIVWLPGAHCLIWLGVPNVWDCRNHSMASRCSLPYMAWCTKRVGLPGGHCLIWLGLLTLILLYWMLLPGYGESGMQQDI